ncbi:unnamed protein product [Rotaria sp. Silwood2]|nr:unnamed protein product [Rotaria sp. Silwood2]CAF4379628.1 unnamed protein product [Rotaria sp. Silwood2]
MLPSQSQTFSPTLLPSSSTFFNNSLYNSSNTMSDSHHSSMLSPSPSEYNSRMSDLRMRQSTFPYRQPITNPHKRFLTRTMENCPANLTGRQRTNWLKAGRKAQNNQQLLSTLDPFHWPAYNYDSPIFIHRRTSESHLYGIIHKISNVHLYTIDTEANRPTRRYPHSLPALIQIQAIHDENYSTVIIIEVQHLPPASSSLFHSIQQLCRMIFSSNNKLMAWGDVEKELGPFEDFNLFDLSQVTNTFDLQKYFTKLWNQMHPHTSDCLARHQPMIDECISEDVLVCFVNSDDIDDEFNPNDPTEDYNTCICPTEIRPYKAKNAVWSLQKAVEFIFHQALDKTLTFNIWSCGLDLNLDTWQTHTDKRTRQSLIAYAMNDLFAPTNLYFHLNKTTSSSSNSPNPINLNTIQLNTALDLPLFLILADSHAKYFPPVITTSSYKLITKSISGLQWVNQSNTQLCATSIILSSSMSSLLSSCSGVFFFIGTNSIRNNSASETIAQVDNLIDLIRSHHIHLNHLTDISISSVFPCLKPSFLFSSISTLLSNINNYNTLLKDLATRKNFTVVDLPITADQLNHDGMHIHINHLPFIWNIIQQYFDMLVLQKTTTRSLSHSRSRTAIARRNKRRHEKQKKRQAIQTVIRPIARIWKLKDLKTYLKYKKIKYGRLPEIRRHQLCIQFNNRLHQQHAEQILNLTDFDEQSYYNWISHEH